MVKKSFFMASVCALMVGMITGCASTDVPSQKLDIEVSETVEEEAVTPRNTVKEKKTETATTQTPRTSEQNRTTDKTQSGTAKTESTKTEPPKTTTTKTETTKTTTTKSGSTTVQTTEETKVTVTVTNVEEKKTQTTITGNDKSKSDSTSKPTSQTYDDEDLDDFIAWLMGLDGNYSELDTGTDSYDDSDDYGNYGWDNFFFGTTTSNVKINEKGMTVETRFDVPEGYERVSVAAGSYEDFYRKLPLKPAGTPIYYYDGQKKNSNYHAAVLDFPQLKEDLLQCADSCMKMRAEYLYSKGYYNKIAFTAESGVLIPFSKYVDGYRLTGSGWKSGYKKGTSREIFDEYLKIVYSYASTRSMAKEIVPIKISDLRIGDVFVKSGSPGHAVFVVDMAVNKKTGKKIMLIGQGYLPAQDLHIVKSMESISPWFYVEDDSWGGMDFSFPKGSQGRWPER